MMIQEHMGLEDKGKKQKKKKKGNIWYLYINHDLLLLLMISAKK